MGRILAGRTGTDDRVYIYFRLECRERGYTMGSEAKYLWLRMRVSSRIFKKSYDPTYRTALKAGQRIGINLRLKHE